MIHVPAQISSFEASEVGGQQTPDPISHTLPGLFTVSTEFVKNLEVSHHIFNLAVYRRGYIRFVFWARFHL